MPGRHAARPIWLRVVISSTSASGPRRGEADHRGVARADAHARRRALRDREPHRSRAGDGRWIQLRAIEVQPSDASAPASRLGVQAHRLHGGDRPWLYARRRSSWTRRSVIRAARVSALRAGKLRPRVLGPVTLRRALEQSRNIPAIKMMDELGPKQVITYARRLGLTSPIPPYLPVALGAAEATLQEMTTAFAVFPNQGVRMTRSTCCGSRIATETFWKKTGRSRTTRSAQTRRSS